jgi:hypothetical protein
MRKPLTLDQRKILEHYKDTDVPAKEIAIKAGIFYKTVFVEYREAGGRHLYNAEVAQKQIETNLARRSISHSFRKKEPELLTLKDRKLIEGFKDSALSGTEIGEKIGRHKNVVNREFKNAGGRSKYNAEKAQNQFEELKEKKYFFRRKPTSENGSELVKVKNDYLDEDLSKDYIENLRGKRQASITEDLAQNLSTTLDIPRLPLKIWIERWKEEKSISRVYWNKEKRYFEFWVKRFGDEIAIDLKPIAIESVADELLTVISRHKRTLGDETRRKYLAYLSTLYTTAIYEWKWAIFNPLHCVKLKFKKEKYKTINDDDFKEFIEFKEKFISLIKKQTASLSQREAALKAGLTLHCFQFAMNPKNNFTMKSFLKICIGYGIKVSLE